MIAVVLLNCSWQAGEDKVWLALRWVDATNWSNAHQVSNFSWAWPDADIMFRSMFCSLILLDVNGFHVQEMIINHLPCRWSP